MGGRRSTLAWPLGFRAGEVSSSLGPRFYICRVDEPLDESFLNRNPPVTYQVLQEDLTQGLWWAERCMSSRHLVAAAARGHTGSRIP